MQKIIQDGKNYYLLSESEKQELDKLILKIQQFEELIQ